MNSKIIVKNSDFSFNNNLTSNYELPFSEHIEELRQRVFHLFWVILLLTCIAFFDVKFLVELLELPVSDVKFFQLSPGEYFISTVKISFYTGLLFGSPFAIGQLLLFLLPGLTEKEKKNHFTLINRIVNIIWIRPNVFILCSNSSCLKLFFKL